MRKIIGVIAAVAATVGLLSAGSVASAVPGPTYTQVPDLAGYVPVDPNGYRSPDFVDNGKTFFVTPGGRVCALGPGYAYAACTGHPSTAPPGIVGAAISAGQTGPYWVPPNTSHTVRPRGWFQPPLLQIGESITVDGSSCAVSRVGVTCVAGPRAFTLTQSWYKFVTPAGDEYHDANRSPEFLPPEQR
ncbi:hypothetical protein [Williamsia muralis]|uniref:hypothetical protein n=1 Tax=Williamsia marianensis TaxID=85044 RepID=UPI00381683AF